MWRAAGGGLARLCGAAFAALGFAFMPFAHLAVSTLAGLVVLRIIHGNCRRALPAIARRSAAAAASS
jgi:hypothetical protein